MTSHTPQTIYLCISDRYDPDAGLYTFREFLGMCAESFGQDPILEWAGRGYQDADGTAVLIPQWAPSPTETERGNEAWIVMRDGEDSGRYYETEAEAQHDADDLNGRGMA